MRLVRVVAKHFVAGFETDGVVRRAAPILRCLLGLTDEEARAEIKRRGWKASVVDQETSNGKACGLLGNARRAHV